MGVFSLNEVRMYFLNTTAPDRPIEEKYITEILGERKSFLQEEDALLYLFDRDFKTFKYLTKEAIKYKDLKNLPTYEFWHIGNRVGYLLYDYQPYINENNEVKKRKAFVWRFVGFGQSCFAQNREELKGKIMTLIDYYKEDPENRGFNIYPYYTKHFRTEQSIK